MGEYKVLKKNILYTGNEFNKIREIYIMPTSVLWSANRKEQ